MKAIIVTEDELAEIQLSAGQLPGSWSASARSRASKVGRTLCVPVTASWECIDKLLDEEAA